MIEIIQKNYEKKCKKPSDINQHLPTLMKYAKECESVLELGVRGCVSSWGFAYGLVNNGKDKKVLFCNDLNPCNIKELQTNCKDIIDVQYKWCSDLSLDFPEESFDMVFIDTLHVYGQLKRELHKFSKIATKYIIMHDTTVDKKHGEVRRIMMKQLETLVKSTGIPKKELLLGLQPAIDEFLQDNSHWKVKEVFNNNNGLTILEKIN
jgi:hypothetical protein